MHDVPPPSLGPGWTQAQASRAELSALTTAKFEATWPAVERKLFRLLRALQVPRERGEDLVQEAALRVLRDRVRYEDAGDLYRWSSVVVRRLVIDVWRVERGLTTDESLPLRASSVDVAVEVERRLALEAVLEKWPELTDRARRAIVLAVEERAVAADEAAALHSARYRARQVLRAATEGLLGWVGVTGLVRGLRQARRIAIPSLVTVAVVVPALYLSSTTEDERRPSPSRQGTSPSSFETTAAHLAPAPVDAPVPRSQALPHARPSVPGTERTASVRAEAPGVAAVEYQTYPGRGEPGLCVDPGPPLPGEKCVPRVRDLLRPGG